MLEIEDILKFVMRENVWYMHQTLFHELFFFFVNVVRTLY